MGCLSSRIAEIDYFSSHEAATREGEFRRFSRKQVDDKKASLAQVIAAHDLQGFCTGSPHPFFSGRNPRAHKGRVGTRPWDWCFLAMTSGVLQYVLDERVKDKVDFIFDENSHFRACRETYYDMKAVDASPFFACAGECLSGNDKEYLPLQMGDLLSGEVNLQIQGRPVQRPWQIIAGARKVIQFPAQPPTEIKEIMNMQEQAHEIARLAREIQKRFYRDKERSVEMLNDALALCLMRKRFDTKMSSMQELYKRDEEYRLLVARKGKYAPLKGKKFK